jgi:hypothetical protein
MSDEILAPVVTVLVLVGLVLWVPTLHLCDGCWQRAIRRRNMRSDDQPERVVQQAGREQVM